MKKSAFLLIELMTALAVVVLFCAIVVRSQKNTWFLVRKSFSRIRLLDESIDDFERQRGRLGCCQKGTFLSATVLCATEAPFLAEVREKGDV